MKIKIAFLGGGIDSAIGMVHRIALEMDKKYELVAGYFSNNQQTNLQTAKEYDIPPHRTYDSLSKLLDNERNNLDAICILTPIPNHKETIIECLRNNIAIICEKALTNSVKSALEIKKLLNENNGYLSMIYNYTGYPMIRELKEMITNKQLGKLHQINIEMPQESYLRLDKEGKNITPQKWRLKDFTIPTLSLDLGTHIYNLAGFLTGENPSELVSLQDNYGLFQKIIDNSITIIKYSNNITAKIWYSKVALGHTNGLKVEVYGDSGSAKWYQLNPENLYFNDNKGRKIIIDRANIDTKIATKQRYNRFKVGHPAGFIEAFANYYSDIADDLFLKKHNPYVFKIEEAIQELKILEAMTTSSQQKKWVQV